jgi:hypothetical protein
VSQQIRPSDVDFFPDLDLDEIPAGTLAVILTDGAQLVLLHCFEYEVGGDGDLFFRHSRRGKVVTYEPGEWSAIGTVEHDVEGGSYVALERFAEAG